MDRTKEFLSIVQFKEIPQYPFVPTDFYSNIREICKRIDESFAQISKVTSYESFRIVPLVKTCSELIEELKRIRINENVTRDYLEVVQNLKSFLNTTHLTYQLKLNEIKRKLNKKTNEKRHENTLNDHTKGEENGALQKNKNYMPNQTQSALMIEQETVHQDHEQIQERKRILRSITEIGQIVEDISIHVRLQEEQLKRIDDIVIQSDKWIKKAKNELLDYWDYARSGRGRIIKYFSLIGLIIFLFWIVKKV